MKRIVSVVILFVSLCSAAWSQEIFVKMDDASNGTIVDALGGSVVVRDDDSQGAGAPDAGSYQYGKDRTVTILANCVSGGRYSFRVDSLDVSCLDTVFVYDGQGTAGTLIAKFNSYSGNVHVGTRLYETPLNTTGMITIRFKTDPRTDTSRTNLACNSNHRHMGFKLTCECGIPCETVVPVINNKFYRTRNGQVYDSAYIHLVTEYRTIYIDENDTSLGIDHIDTVEFYGANLCIGDGVIFRGHGDYTHNYGYYDPSDATSYFRWDMGFENDSVAGIGQVLAEYNDYQTTGCFDVRLDLVDAYGCVNSVVTFIKVRTAMNPIKTIFTLQEICNKDSLAVNMGYEGEDATLTLKRIETEEAIGKTFDVRTFIPDGCDCGAVSYYEAPVEFTEFPNSRKVTSAKDICSLCVNMEHSFLGDFFMTLVCPTGQEAIIKFGNKTNQTGCTYPNPNTRQDVEGSAEYGPAYVNGVDHGSGKNLGFPLDYGGGVFASGSADNSPKCDSLSNPYGIGLDYCFSRDTHYTLVTGENAKGVWNSTTPCPVGDFYIVSNAYMDNLPVTFPAVPYGFVHAGEVPTASGGTITTKHPSNRAEMSDYYLPWTTFRELVGCPLNGLWKVRVYDTWGADNGWIFNWSLDICNVLPDDCNYQVGVDSLVWVPDPSPQYHDYDLGHYRGLTVNAESPTLSHILSPDTAGTFPIIVKVYDEFGCVWDTNTSITTYWTPMPNLGEDTSLCGVDKMVLDAADRHAATENYSYVWAPFGQNTQTITTMDGAYGEVNYVVQVTNTRHDLTCITQDTIRVGSRRQPMPSFIPTPFAFEGCEPFTLHFDNRTVYAGEHLWVFGDGITSSLASPTHTYAAGVYDLKYYVTSPDGCVDSIISPQSIAVFSAPKAGFTWSPVYPSVLNPVATFNNLTEPKTDDTKYFWEIQYNIDNPLSVETLTEEYPTFNFSQWTDNDPSGNYAVRLIARTDNLAPSGNMVYCRDTTENTILVVNDFLQFPNVVSPNGDGINDRFVIKNLVNGMGYPINQLDIYNKWGARVFHKENISRDEDFWDPKDMPAGTYFYRFSAKGYNGNIEHNGAIEVVK
ncbi:MAG: gliding motility-associated C-terminal domain-containing protein [Bacteroidales bacterium]|nr:gliding motility-associated C-terminal domain-containing protein [Bacteroidales bacterium]